MDLDASDRRSSLVELLSRLNGALEVADPPSIAGLVKQAQAVLKELDELPNADGEVSPLDELRAARVARRTGTESDAGSGRRNQQRRTGRVSAS